MKLIIYLIVKCLDLTLATKLFKKYTIFLDQRVFILGIEKTVLVCCYSPKNNKMKKEFFSKYELINEELKNEVNHSLTSFTIFTRTKSRILEFEVKVYISLLDHSIYIQELYLKGKQVHGTV